MNPYTKALLTTLAAIVLNSKDGKAQEGFKLDLGGNEKYKQKNVFFTRPLAGDYVDSTLQDKIRTLSFENSIELSRDRSLNKLTSERLHTLEINNDISRQDLLENKINNDIRGVTHLSALNVPEISATNIRDKELNKNGIMNTQFRLNLLNLTYQQILTGKRIRSALALPNALQIRTTKLRQYNRMAAVRNDSVSFDYKKVMLEVQHNIELLNKEVEKLSAKNDYTREEHQVGVDTAIMAEKHQAALNNTILGLYTLGRDTLEQVLKSEETLRKLREIENKYYAERDIDSLGALVVLYNNHKQIQGIRNRMIIENSKHQQNVQKVINENNVFSNDMIIKNLKHKQDIQKVINENNVFSNNMIIKNLKHRQDIREIRNENKEATFNRKIDSMKNVDILKDKLLKIQIEKKATRIYDELSIGQLEIDSLFKNLFNKTKKTDPSGTFYNNDRKELNKKIIEQEQKLGFFNEILVDSNYTESIKKLQYSRSISADKERKRFERVQDVFKTTLEKNNDKSFNKFYKQNEDRFLRKSIQKKYNKKIKEAFFSSSVSDLDEFKNIAKNNYKVDIPTNSNVNEQNPFVNKLLRSTMDETSFADNSFKNELSEKEVRHRKNYFATSQRQV